MSREIITWVSYKRLLFLGVIIALGVAFAGWAGTTPVFAEDEISIKVYDGSTEKSITGKELEQIAQEEGNKTYDYSGSNSHPTQKRILGAKGPTVEGILRSLKIRFDDDTTIEFKGNDGASLKILMGQLTATRYYFKNAVNEDGRKGQPPLVSSCEPREIVPAIISLNNEGRLLFGQTSPTEQNYYSFISYIASKIPGEIRVSHDTPEKWSSISSTTPQNGATVTSGTPVTFNKTADQNERGYYIYYTVDGSEPSMYSSLYNYNSYYFGTPQEAFSKPILTGDRDITIKAKVTGYGKLDSDPITLNYRSVPAPATPWERAKAISYQGIRINWGAINGASGYEIYRSMNYGHGYTLCGRIHNGGQAAWTNYGLKTGSRYYYKIRAYKTVNGVNIYGGFSAVSSALPILNKTYIRGISSKKRDVTIRWSAVAGASGYQLYRSTNPKRGFALVRTAAGGKNLTFVNKKMKKKKVFYYKVRPYRNVAGKRVYGGFSPVKMIKVK